MPELPIIDAQAIENLQSINPDDGGEFVREIAGIFLEDTPLCIQSLDKCLVSGDVATFTRSAHSIKGSSANMGANRLRHAAERLELHAKVSGLSQTGPLIQAVKDEFAAAAAEIRRTLL
jgi:HPt (histidine-containing phosphotransfer) domain-containing protein